MTDHEHRRGTAPLVFALVAGVALLVGGWLAAPAGAHGGPGTISVVERGEPEPLQLRYVVEIRYIGDDHLAVPATFSATATGPGGATLGPVDLTTTDEEGVYTLELEVPEAGDWEVAFASTLPPSEAVDVFPVTGEPTQEPETTEAPESDGDPNGLGASPDEAGTGPETIASEGSGPPAGLIIGLVVAGLAVVVAAFVAVRVVRNRPT